jgi:hypothetical protein
MSTWSTMNIYAVTKEKLFHEFFRACALLFAQLKFIEVHTQRACIEFKFPWRLHQWLWRDCTFNLNTFTACAKDLHVSAVHHNKYQQNVTLQLIHIRIKRSGKVVGLLRLAPCQNSAMIRVHKNITAYEEF